ncbi:MAG: EF-P lysine aminoacylase EpmA [Candidatus Uhrbacteria bacterium]
MNSDFIRARSQVVKLVRRYFDEQGFLELHTPRLVGLPGQEPYLEPLWTSVSEQRAENKEHRAALITSPEYAMKRMLGAGFDKIYDLGPCFRNGEPWDGTHDPEFLMLEWYEKNIGLPELMDRTEAMVEFVGARFIAPVPAGVFVPSDISVPSDIFVPSDISVPSDVSVPADAPGAREQGVINHAPTPSKPFRRLTVRDAMKQYADVDLDLLLGDREAMADACRAHHQTVGENDTWDDLFFKIFLSEVEPHLGEVPTFLYNYPASMAALARKDPTDPRYALRTELYIGALELANGFAELSDAVEQRARFEEEQALRKTLGKEVWPIDERFMAALPSMGNAAGIAFGVDRLAMLLTGTDSISALMPIPVGERF